MKRRIAKLIVFVLAGAVVNVAVAWGCAIAFEGEHQTGVSVSRVLGRGGGLFKMTAGIPMRCLRGEQSGSGRWNHKERAMYATSTSKGLWITGNSGHKRFVPLIPIFPGFAINTIFYAAILWVLLAAPFKVRRWRRRRRGQCPACGYPVGASAVCSECGAELTQKAETQKAEITA